MAVTGLLLSPSLAAVLARKGAADSVMLESGVNTWPGAGLVIGEPAGGPVTALVGDVRAAPARCAGEASALPEATTVPTSRPAAAMALISVRVRGRRCVIGISSMEKRGDLRCGVSAYVGPAT